MRYVPDGSLCIASVEQIFPRDGVQRNCFELALYIASSSPYIMTASQIASVRVFKTALPTLSVRDRAIIVLNHHRFWGYASGPSSSGNTLPSSVHGHAARRSALPRERFSPMARSGRGVRSDLSPQCAPKWTWRDVCCESVMRTKADIDDRRQSTSIWPKRVHHCDYVELINCYLYAACFGDARPRKD